MLVQQRLKLGTRQSFPEDCEPQEDALRGPRNQGAFAVSHRVAMTWEERKMEKR